MDWESVSCLLAEAYSNPRHGNPEAPTDCLFYLMLSRKTPIATAARVFERLKALVQGDWTDLLSLPGQAVVDAIHGSGLEEIRAGHIKLVGEMLHSEFGGVTLEPLRGWQDAEVLRFLTALPGVGAKTALCVMMYSLGRRVFPADAHCIRILQRMGVIPTHLEHRPAQRRLADLVPPHLAYALHVNLVAHGQQVCRAGKPACDSCVVRRHCALGTEVQVAAEGSAQYEI